MPPRLFDELDTAEERPDLIRQYLGPLSTDEVTEDDFWIDPCYMGLIVET